MPSLAAYHHFTLFPSIAFITFQFYLFHTYEFHILITPQIQALEFIVHYPMSSV